jgi:SAM-dependent methyltransferase
MEPKASETRYLLSASLYHVPRFVQSRVRRVLQAFDQASRYSELVDFRTPERVKANYDSISDGSLDLDFDGYVYGDASKRDHVLIGGHVRYGSVREARGLLLEHLAEVVSHYAEGVAGPLVVEVGSGNGRNLFFLKSRLPAVRCLGLDLSPVSVERSRTAARKFGLDVAFLEADATRPFPDLPDRPTVVFSIHALEQMPRIFPRAVDSILALAPRAAVFFEPVSELYPWSPRGLLSRARVVHMDYLQGLYRYLKSRHAPVVTARRLGFAQHPLDETCEIHVLGEA